jgi:hypothetical protein
MSKPNIMLLDLKKHDQLTMVFVIPNVSRLLIYRDNWNKVKVMRKVIAEMLQSKFFPKLNARNRSAKEVEHGDGYHDCAIVRLKIHGLDRLGYEPKSTAELFANEIVKEDNTLQFDNELINDAENVTKIGFDIEINKPRRSRVSKKA